ncbi:MAG: DUF1127 domain-containing protein [Ruegeria sp.]
MTQVVLTTPKRNTHAFGPATFNRVIGLVRQRRALANLDDHALNDIGVSRAEAKAESKRPFWDAPDAWRK